MKVKTSELIGAALDWSVLEALKPDLKHPERAGISTFGPLFGKGYKYPSWGSTKYAPSRDWKEGGPIIDRDKICTIHYESDENGNPCEPGWTAYIWREFPMHGPTALVAAMRCFVTSRLGDEVDVPDELKGE